MREDLWHWNQLLDWNIDEFASSNCLAKELARRNSSAMSPAACLRTCVHACLSCPTPQVKRDKATGLSIYVPPGGRLYLCLLTFLLGYPPPAIFWGVLTLQSCYCPHSASTWSAARPRQWLLPGHLLFPPKLQVVQRSVKWMNWYMLLSHGSWFWGWKECVSISIDICP